VITNFWSRTQVKFHLFRVFIRDIRLRKRFLSSIILLDHFQSKLNTYHKMTSSISLNKASWSNSSCNNRSYSIKCNNNKNRHHRSKHFSRCSWTPLGPKLTNNSRPPNRIYRTCINFLKFHKITSLYTWNIYLPRI
jgi:hypothetical protein